jgi:AraC-like DNA-binding protein
MITHDREVTVLGIGNVVLYDTSRPDLAAFASKFPTTGQPLLFLWFPRSVLPRSVRDLWRMDTLSPSEADRLSALTLGVLTAALDNAVGNQSAGPPHTRQRALITRIHAFIEKNLGDTDLTPSTIATAHHISVRYLHKLFQQNGHAVAGWIRERRLEKCWHDLANPHLVTRPINTIAAQWGFTNSAHFSQAFRNAYGLSPRQFRQQCMAVRAD